MTALLPVERLVQDDHHIMSSMTTTQFIREFAVQFSPNVLAIAVSVFSLLLVAVVTVLVKRHKVSHSTDVYLQTHW